MTILHLLGPAHLIVRGEVMRLSALLAAVLYYLACQSEWVNRDELLYLFYPAADEASARVNLRQLLRRIQELPFVMLEREGNRLRWQVESDMAAFEAAASRDDRAELLRLYRGPLLQDFPSGSWPEFENWLEVRRGELASRYVHEAVAHSEDLQAAGQHDEALATVAEAHRLEPTHEGLLRHYLQALAHNDRLVEVKAVYEGFRQRLKTDLGGEPERETQALVATLVTPSRREPTPHNLPPSRTTFVGRAQELTRLRDHMLDPRVRALTVVGPGGIGKTRLALEAARSLQPAGPFEGLTFVGLANLTDASAIPGAIAEALGLGSETGLAALLEYLGGKRLLLLLDNLEQLPGAAGVLSPLLDACPRVTLLATSRESLGLYGERAFVVPALSLPDLRQVSFEDVSGSEAAQVFAQRAQAVNPDFTLTRENAPAVAELCHRLDGLPLALELAAGRARLLSPQALVARLSERLKLLEQGPRSLPPRQQTMQGAIGWSYDLLPDAEQRLFRRLAVFSGGCPLTGVGAVCLENEDDALDLCDALVRKNLLKVYSNGEGETRLFMLELLHAYALQRLADSGEEAATRMAHARYFLTFARESDAALRGPEQATWLTRLEHDHDNLRAALGWAEVHNPNLGLELAGALQGFWDRRAHYAEGRGWLERVLENAPQAPASLRAPAHNAVGVLARMQGDYSDSQRHLQAGLELFTQLDDRVGRASCLNNLGTTAENAGELEAARDAFTEALEHYRELADHWGEAGTLNNLGNVVLTQKGPESATPFFRASLECFRVLGDGRSAAMLLGNLGGLALEGGDTEAAMEQLSEATTSLFALGDTASTLYLLERLAALHGLSGRADVAAALYGATAVLREASGVPLEAADEALIEAERARSRAELGEVAWAEHTTRGEVLTLEAAVALALGGA